VLINRQKNVGRLTAIGDHDGPAVGLAFCGADITVELARGHRRHRHHLRSFVGTYLLYAAQLWPATTRGDPARRVGNLTTWCHTLKRNSTAIRSEEHTSELQSRFDLVCRLLLEKKQSL